MNQGPGSIGLIKGALVVVSASGGARETINFQYNPAQLRRSLKPSSVGGEPGGHSEAVRFVGAPEETFDLEIEIEALAQTPPASPQLIASKGIYPQLYLLETLTYPSLSQVKQNTQLLSQGTLEITPYVAPLVLLVWGENRVAPVAIASYSVVEQAFDNELNPIRATVSLSTRVLSYSDLTSSAPGYSQFMAYQQSKETLAKQGLEQSSSQS